MDQPPFHFCFNTYVSIGAGVSQQLSGILEKHGWKKAGVVVDQNLLPVPLVQNLLQSLQAVCEKLVIAHCTISEPAYETLEAARPPFMAQDLQAIIGIGGGSALDMAKAMAVLVHNRRPAISYRGFDRIDQPVLPIIALPTTAGTGSEITPNASFIDTHEQRKLGINGEALRPRYALLDPELTVSCPARPTVSAGVDSIVHAVEAYVAKKTNPLARLLAKEGFAKVFNHLPSVLQAPTEVSLRAEVQYGAFLSAIALMNSGTGPAAAMSYPLGVRFKVAHGIGGALFLPHVVKHNIQHGFFDYGDLYEVMDRADPTLSQAARAQRFQETLAATWQRLGVPVNLAATGFTKSSTEVFVAETLQLKAALDQNPVPFGENDIRRLLRALSSTE